LVFYNLENYNLTSKVTCSLRIYRLILEMPFGQLPVLEIDGQRLAQSHSIVRFLARQYGLAGKSAFEEALVDSITDQYKDFFQETRVYFDVVLGYAEGDLRFKKVLLFDNSAPHRVQVSTDKLGQLGYVHMPHPPYSPNISPCEYHHLLGLRDFLVGRDTRIHAVLDNHIELLINTRPKQFWKDGIRKLAERWQQGPCP
uniref:glutathione transferase n=1 Tax=Heligmosomoides polygyrus TaxID=6339 RepID=A0A183GPJ4_HELPZ